jgi:cytochrome c-type biogenesis protein CcmH
MKRLLALVALLCALAAPAAAAPADLANAIAGEVMSPFCPGLTLHDCPSQAASDLRARIEAWARAGLGRAEIMERLRREYGSAIEASPPRSGVGWLAWLLPAVVLVAAAAAAVSFVHRAASRDGSAPSPALAPSPEERARLDAELSALRESP